MTFNLSRSVSRIGFAASLGLGGSVTANATLITPNGSFSGALTGGSVTSDSVGGIWDIGGATTQIQVMSGTTFISGDTDPYLDNPNNLLARNGGTVKIGDPFSVSQSMYHVANGPLANSIIVTFDQFSFTLTNEVVTADPNGDIGLAFVGTVTAAPTGYSIGEAVDFSIGFTESGPTGAIGVGYSIDAPIKPLIATVPEPPVLPVFAMATICLGVIVGRRFAKSDCAVVAPVRVA